MMKRIRICQEIWRHTSHKLTFQTLWDSLLKPALAIFRKSTYLARNRSHKRASCKDIGFLIAFTQVYAECITNESIAVTLINGM